MKKKHFLFTSLTIAAILSANVAQAEELTGPVTDPSQELVDNENQDSSPQPHQEGDLAINTRSASPTEEPAFSLGDPNQPGVEVTIDRQLNQTAVREEALTAMRELREEMWDLNPWFDGKKLQDAVKAAGFQGKADYAQALEWDNELEAYAVQRSVEVSYVWAHNRPDGSDALDTAPEKVHGENLSMGYPTVTAAIKQSWGYGELDALNATQGFLSKPDQKVNGHLHNQLNPRFKSFGVGASEKHYAQSLSFSASEQTDGLKFDGKHTIKLKVTEELAKHEDFVIKTPKNEEPKKEELKPEGPKNDGTNKDELKKNENGNKPTPKNIIVITEKAGVPKVAEVTNHVTEVEALSYDSVDASAFPPTLRLEQIEQPLVLTYKWTNEVTGEVFTQPHLIDVESTTEGNLTFQAPYRNLRLPLGRYRLEVLFNDLENNLLTLDDGSLEKLQALPPVEVKRPEFVEPVLVSVTADKSVIKKGEEVTYTLTFDRPFNKNDRNFSTSFQVSDSENPIWKYGLRTSNIHDHVMKILVSSSTPVGKLKLEFDDETYSYFSTKLGNASQTNRDKLSQLLPEVTVLDEDYTPISVIGLTLFKADGSQENLPPLGIEGPFSTIVVKPGDKIVYHLALNEELKEANLYAYIGFKDDQTGDLNVSVHKDQSLTDKIVDLEMPVASHHYGIFNWERFGLLKSNDHHINLDGLFNSYGGYIFQVDNPKPAFRFEQLSPLRPVNYLDEYVHFTAKLDDSINLEQLSEVYLPAWKDDKFFEIHLTPDAEYIYHYDDEGKTTSSERVLSDTKTLFGGFLALDSGKITFNTAQLVYKDGTLITLPDFGGLSLTISDEKKHVMSHHGFFLLSKEDSEATPSNTPYYSSLGRVPEELKNRSLNIQKILLHDKAGQVVTTPNSELIISNSIHNDDSDVYYYLPFSGQLTKLETTERASRYGKDWLVPIKDTRGVYIIAAPVNKEISDTTNQTKILSGEASDVTVRLTNSDVNAVSRITTKKVDDDQVLNKLPNGIHAEDIDLFDIKTLDKDGNFVQINDEAIVTLPVVPGRKVVNVIYFLPQTGAIEELPYEWSQEFNQVVFKVSHFSNYGVVYEGESDKQAEPPAPQGQENNQQPPAPQGQGNSQQPPAPQGQEDNQQPPAPQGQENNQQSPAPQTQTGMDIEAIKNGDYSSIQGVWNKVNDEQGQPEFIRITDNGFFSAPELNFKAVKLGEVKEVPNRYKWGRMVVASSAGYPTDWLGYHNSEGSGATYIPKGGAYSLWDANLGKSVEKIATEDIIISRGLGYEAVYTRARSVAHFYGVTAGDYGMGTLVDSLGRSIIDNKTVVVTGQIGDTIDLNAVGGRFGREGNAIYRVTLSNGKDELTLPDYQSSFVLDETTKGYTKISIVYDTAMPKPKVNDNNSKQNQPDKAPDTAKPNTNPNSGERQAYTAEQELIARVWKTVTGGTYPYGVVRREAGSKINYFNGIGHVFPKVTYYISEHSNRPNALSHEVTFSDNGDGTVTVYKVPKHWHVADEESERLTKEILDTAQVIKLDELSKSEIETIVKRATRIVKQTIRYEGFSNGSSKNSTPQGQGNGKQTLAPQADLSTRRNQLLLELDKSPLTDEQKGQLAEKFAFANTEKELADVTAEFKRLTAALGQDSKPQTPQAPQKADAKATLPATGEAKPVVLATIGAGLLLASLGLAYHRKRSE